MNSSFLFSQDTIPPLIIDDSETTYSFGFFAGPSFANNSSETTYFEYESRWGIDAGISFEAGFTEHWSLRSDLAYFTRGYQFPLLFTDNFGNIVGEGFSRTTLNYLSIPVKGQFAYGEKLQILGYAGVYGSMILGAKSMIKLEDSDGTEYVEEVKDDVSPFDFGVVGGLGLNIPVNRMDVSLRSNYFYGFGDVIESSFAESFNRAFNLELGLTWKLNDQ